MHSTKTTTASFCNQLAHRHLGIVMRGWSRLGFKLHFALLSLAVVWSCEPDIDCFHPDGQTSIYLDTSNSEPGPTGSVENLRICPSAPLSDGAGFTLPVSEVRGELMIEAEADITFPNLERVGVLAIVARSTVRVPALLSAGEINVYRAVELDAPALVDVDVLQLDGVRASLPRLARIGDGKAVGGDVDFSGLAFADTLEIGASERPCELPSLLEIGSLTLNASACATFAAPKLARAGDLQIVANRALQSTELPTLSDLDALTATQNPKLKNCALQALAMKASVPPGNVTLAGNSDEACAD